MRSLATELQLDTIMAAILNFPDAKLVFGFKREVLANVAHIPYGIGIEETRWLNEAKMSLDRVKVTLPK